MRRPLLALVIVALATSACSSATSTEGPQVANPPEHHLPTYPPPEQPQPRPQATPYPDVNFEDPGVNRFVDPRDDRESTFALDVDTASYTIAQRYIADGNLPDPSSVRVEEYVNSFDQGYAAPKDDTFAIHTDGGPSPFLAADEVLLRIGLKAREVSDGSRPDAALTFVIDVSGSMAQEDRLELVKHALGLLVEELRPSDTVGIVVFGDEARIVLEPTPAGHGSQILRAINSLEPEGSTNAEAGLELGYEMARRNPLEGGINRVILASDGVANVGLTDPAAILAQIHDAADSGIQLVSVGVGMGNYNDALLEQLADDGDGFYAYVNTIDEARRLFIEDLTSTLQTVALDARVQVDFNPEVVGAYRLIGFENRAVPDKDFRNEDLQAGAIGAGHAVTALYALRLSEDGSGQGRIGTVNLRWTDPTSGRAEERAQDVRLLDLVDRFGATAPTFQLDALVAAAAERFRGSSWAERYSLRDIFEVADESGERLPQTDDVRAFLRLLETAARMEG